MKLFKTGMPRYILAAYVLILMLAGFLAAQSNYRQLRAEYVAKMNVAQIYLKNEYLSLTMDFWQYYMPIFEIRDTVYESLDTYFAKEPPENETSVSDLTPLQKQRFTAALSQMSARGNRLCWIAAISESRTVNYIYYTRLGQLLPIEPSFPFLDELRPYQSPMEVIGSREMSGSSYRCFAIRGGVPSKMGNGCLLFGFEIGSLQDIAESADVPFESLDYRIVENGHTIFSSKGRYDDAPSDDAPVFIMESEGMSRNASIYYTVSEAELFSASWRSGARIFLLILALMAASLVLFGFQSALMNREINVIRDGLNRIGLNHLDFRFAQSFRQSGFNEIAEAINAMTQNLQETVERAYYYELKQRDNELAELQAKFNPHFLYNTLELFRARCFQRGDADTARLIADTATIFRGLIGSRRFISIREELTFSQHYLSLFRARYGEHMRVYYDIDPEVLDYGVIRNVFQPLIENYFVHGFNARNTDNFLRISGSIIDADTILISVADNGMGMTEAELASLNARLSDSSNVSTESYGLKNLYQRLRLYYGDAYGLAVDGNADGGLTVSMRIARIRAESAAGQDTDKNKCDALLMNQTPPRLPDDDDDENAPSSL